MADLLLNLARHALARKVVKKSGLPIPLPQELRRDVTPWVQESLRGQTISLGSFNDAVGELKDLASVLMGTGVNLDEQAEYFNGLVFDGTGLQSPADLSAVYQYFHERLGRLSPCAHIVIIGRAPQNLSAANAATQAALSGFVRSLAKEFGGKGVTVNLLQSAVGQDKGRTLAGALRFFLSHRSSYITGQVVVLNAHGSTIKFDRLLEGKTILVTGAAQGIGAAIARRIAAEGGKVLLLDRPEEMEALENMAREVHGTKVAVDLLKSEAIDMLMKRLRELAPIHGVVHNAGITMDKTLFKMKPEAWDRTLKLNLEVPVKISDLMMDKEHDYLCAKGCSFVFLSSIGGIAGNPGQTNYSASKAGLIGYAKAMAAAISEETARFNCVAPGFIETRMTKSMPMAVREVARRLNSLKQAGQPDDVAQAVVFMLSDASNCMNGETLRVCGQNVIGQ